MAYERVVTALGGKGMGHLFFDQNLTPPMELARILGTHPEKIGRSELNNGPVKVPEFCCVLLRKVVRQRLREATKVQVHLVAMHAIVSGFKS